MRREVRRMREKGKGARSEAEKPAEKDEKLELLRRRRMSEIMKHLQTRKAEEGRKAEDPKKILRRIVTDRAWEVLKAAEKSLLLHLWTNSRNNADFTTNPLFSHF